MLLRCPVIHTLYGLRILAPKSVVEAVKHGGGCSAVAVGEVARRRATGWLATYSVDILRVSVGLVFLVFGALKFFPGLSPAADLAVRTVETLTLGLVPGGAALVLTAIAECFVGITLVSGKLLRSGLAVLGISLVGIMSPLVLHPWCRECSGR